MKITVKRATAPDLLDRDYVKIIEATGVLYEYNGMQFCICLCDGSWYAIELRTGHSAAEHERKLNEVDEYCVAKIKENMRCKPLHAYNHSTKACELFMVSRGFDIPINKKIITDENN